jgi:hypothetical protein
MLFPGPSVLIFDSSSSALLGTTTLTWWKPTVFSGVCTLMGTAIIFATRNLQSKAKGTWKV